MQDWQVKLQLECMAVMARVEGMKAQNMRDTHNGSKPQYDYDDFDALACEIEGMAQEIVRY